MLLTCPTLLKIVTTHQWSQKNILQRGQTNLEELFHILQQVYTAVGVVILLWTLDVSTSYYFLTKRPLSTLLSLPLLTEVISQCSDHRTATWSGQRIKYQYTWPIKQIHQSDDVEHSSIWTFIGKLSGICKVAKNQEHELF